MFLAPATLDFFASFLQFTALAFISASSYQILKMLQMPFVVVLSIIFLKRQFSVAQYLSVGTVIMGLAIVTLTDIFGSSNGSVSPADQTLAVAGFCCMVVGQILHAG